MSLVLDLTQMVLAVRKHHKMTNIIMLDNFYVFNFPVTSIPGEVLALGLHLDVLGAGLDPDGHGCPETPANYQYDHI